jgi:hypothetical protein
VGNQNPVCGFVGFAVLADYLVVRVVWEIVGGSDCYVYATLKLRWHLEQHIPEPTFSFFRIGDKQLSSNVTGSEIAAFAGW